MSKNKRQGTRHESWIVKLLQAAGHPARRLAEGGALDEGDVLTTIYGEEWVWEAKARQTLNIQETLGKTRRKAGGRPVLVCWRRLVPVAGKSRRQPVAGEPCVVILSPADLFRMLDAAYAAGQEGTGLVSGLFGVGQDGLGVTDVTETGDADAA